jgi:hypothetical protein
MRRWIKVTLLAGGLATAGLVGYGAGKIGAHAQGGPGMMGQGMMGQGMGPGMGQGMGPGMMGERGHGGGHRHMGGRHGGPFAGFFINRDNKNLSNDDVKAIAEAGLLWFGERGWAIGEVKDAGSRTAEFTLTTREGGVIARFTMDRDTGRIRRVA